MDEKEYKEKKDKLLKSISEIEIQIEELQKAIEDKELVLQSLNKDLVDLIKEKRGE